MSLENGSRERISTESGTSSNNSSSGNRNRASLNGYRKDLPEDDAYEYQNYDRPSLDASPRGATGKQRNGANILSPKRSRDRGGSTRDLVRLLIAERDSKDALRALNKTADRLEEEQQRANDLEKRLAEANERWRVVNQARQTAQAESARVIEELRLYKLQLEAAQLQITRANEMIKQSDNEKIIAEEAADKATRLANKYKEERLVHQAKEDGRRIGREEGFREGKKMGYNDALNYAYSRAREDVMRRLDAYLIRNGLATDETLEDDLHDLNADDEHAEYEAEDMPVDPRRRLEVVQSSQGPMPMPEPEPSQSGQRAVPPPQNSHFSESNVPLAQNRPRRSGTLFNRLLRPRRGQGDMDSNVEVNRGAPDVAQFVDDGPIPTVATPVPSPYVAQVGRERAQMPEPDYNPDPSQLRPISVYNRPHTPSHPRVDIPPDGYIPMQEADGSIGLPPPHEMVRTPVLGNSPVAGSSTLPPVSQPPSNNSIHRDMYYEGQQMPRQRYQKSVAGDSVISTATSNLSILTPPGARQAAGPRLTAIPERSPYGEQTSLNMGGDGASIRRPRSRASEMIIPVEDDLYHGDPSSQFTEHRQKVADELRDSDYNNMAHFSPRSTRTSGSRGPRRPSKVTTPAPLGGASGSDYQMYTRPRVNSGASDRTGFTDPRSQRNGGIIAGSDFRRMQPPAAEMAPEINIEPPSRTESQRSQRTVMPQPSVAVSSGSSYVNPTYGPDFQYRNPLSGAGASQMMVPVPSPQAVPIIPTEELPMGFIPSSITPAIPSQHLPAENLPAGFVPISATPAAPSQSLPEEHSTNDFPAGFVPMSAAPTNAPLPSMPEPTMPERSPSLAGALPTFPKMPIPGQFSGVDVVGSNWDTPSYSRSPRSRTDGHADHMGRPVSPRPHGIIPQTSSASYRTPGPSSRGLASPNMVVNSVYGRPVSPIPQRGGPVVPPLVFPSSYGDTLDASGAPVQRPYTPSQASTGHSRSYSAAAPTQRAPSPGPSLGGVPIIPPKRGQSPGTGLGRSVSMNEGSVGGRSPRAGYVSFPNPQGGGGPMGPVIPGLPPDGLRTPYSRRMEPENMGGSLSRRNSAYTLTTTPGRAREGAPLPDAVYPGEPGSPALTGFSHSSRVRRARLPESTLGGDSPRNSRVYPRTPHNRSSGLDDEPGVPIVPPLMDMQRPSSRMSNKSYKSFDAGSYVDPAILASGESTLLKNKRSTGSGFGGFSGWD